tara:strand:- start:2331 stop:2732 length:402 start_codon:yes stop_codon:yes gene_type:complete
MKEIKFRKTEKEYVTTSSTKFKRMSDLQEAILALTPDSDECIEVNQPLADAELINLIAPINLRLKNNHGLFGDDDTCGSPYEPDYPRYSVRRMRHTVAGNGPHGEFKGVTFFVRTTRRYVRAMEMDKNPRRVK